MYFIQKINVSFYDLNIQIYDQKRCYFKHVSFYFGGEALQKQIFWIKPWTKNYIPLNNVLKCCYYYYFEKYVLFYAQYITEFLLKTNFYFDRL